MYEIHAPIEHESDLSGAELLGVINKLQEIIRAYERMAGKYEYAGAKLRDERNRARALAATLEAECNNCWGPAHSQVIADARTQCLMGMTPYVEG